MTPTRIQNLPLQSSSSFPRFCRCIQPSATHKPPHTAKSSCLFLIGAIRSPAISNITRSAMPIWISHGSGPSGKRSAKACGLFPPNYTTWRNTRIISSAHLRRSSTAGSRKGPLSFTSVSKRLCRPAVGRYRAPLGRDGLQPHQRRKHAPAVLLRQAVFSQRIWAGYENPLASR